MSTSGVRKREKRKSARQQITEYLIFERRGHAFLQQKTDQRRLQAREGSGHARECAFGLVMADGMADDKAFLVLFQHERSRVNCAQSVANI